MLKKAIAILTCIILLTFSLSSLSFSAAPTSYVEKGIVTVATVTGNTGDTVIVPITIDENPGICGVTVSITYDSTALEFIEDMPGNVIYEYLTKAHPSKNIIRLVTCEQGNKYNNGTLVSLKFKIADKASAGLHKMTINYGPGDFCNWKLDKIMPKIISGGVNVNLSESNCPHKNYGEWTEAAIPTCTLKGAEKHICKDCGHVELRDTDPIGHKYSDKYTIDKEATKTETGLMSRHCIRCKDFTDQISYTLKDSDDGNIKNEFDTTVPPNAYIDNLHKEQYPEEKPESSSTQSNSSVSSSKPVPPTESDKPESQPEVSDESQTDTEEPKEETDTKQEVITIKDKIKEVFPFYEKIIKILTFAIITVLSVLVI